MSVAILRRLECVTYASDLVHRESLGVLLCICKIFTCDTEITKTEVSLDAAFKGVTYSLTS
jgi:hypothetical protein